MFAWIERIGQLAAQAVTTEPTTNSPAMTAATPTIRQSIWELESLLTLRVGVEWRLSLTRRVGVMVGPAHQPEA